MKRPSPGGPAERLVPDRIRAAVWERDFHRYEAVRRQRTAIGQFDGGKLTVASVNGALDGGLPVFAALCEKALEHRGARAPRGEIAGVFLENGPAHLLAVDLRIATRQLGALQLLEGNTRIAQDRHRRFLVLVVALYEPQNADAMVQLTAPARLVLLPERQRARRHVRVHRARPISRADDTRLATRARA